ncbi:MAG: riboflavin biosynthesis protein RibF, partial [Candidatus Kapabacteria bacterium]|nr:riboflavin biosynthesis protein RibF [Candidatus Kapabacteria bacterium]
FTFEFSQTDAASFIREQIVPRTGVSDFLVGYDHTFGKDRSGNETLIAELGKELGYTSEVVPPLMIDDKKISSTQIRRALQSGVLDNANFMLGYEYSLDGIVVEGDGRGRHLGYPTANVESMDINKMLPRYGVYLVSSVIEGQLVFGMANIGTRPTFTDDTHPRLEVNYFDVNPYLYDRKLTVTFHAFIRPEMKFESVDMFWSQLRDDRDMCEDIIAGRNAG